ncbi:hypothetical protein L3067_13770 [Xanthomonas sp. PPL568]|uniref:hypothetical protein n=1 Tax=Xanthomonas indica TaxID=2912242 RepID=UPI001F57574C|nr:hypothetical protein [Xanthomonas indica]MCI2245672.1 hypothetical protein [Xanthomonas indica]
MTIACTVLGLGMLLNSSTPVQAAQTGDTAAELVATELSSSYSEQQKVIRKNAQIHSASGLSTYLAKNEPSDSPLNHLSPAARKRFLESLKFNENGVTSFYYADIESQLTSSQAYALLSLFGLQSTLQFMPKLRTTTDGDKEIMRAFGSGSTPGIPTPEDHNDYWCSGRATCSRNIGSICTGNC